MEMQSAKPQKEHEFLSRIVGDWIMTASSGHENYDANDPSQRFTGTVRSIGGLWIVGEGTGKMPDGDEMTAVITVGFDPAKGNFVGSWIGSMMTYLWVYRGWLEEDGKTLTLEAEGPAFDGSGRIDTYRDVLVLHDDNHRSFSGSVRQPDGTFKTFMTSEFRRKG
ncbi:DUF1579 domain-containing protein [Agrobacterium genomosp. 3]|uniref:DUF1579 domain-containing protein n=1 Tax=Agrobacterium tomkonis TaxID=1183410 RepID=UPI001CD8AFD9|nr:DUF1579 domain-containing protein [Agrobacterium tomkonis]MCA1879069.1 DUF1579 domain-containing protein [Agrobacterium tumefaciens]MCA1894296.1 DUF1579 domain-containing protein [Agrobacterium tomkonis]